MGIIDYVLGIVVLGSLLGIYVMNKQQGSNPNAQKIAMALFAVVVIAGVALAWHAIFAKIGEEDRVISANDRYHASQAYVFGNIISEKSPGAKVLVVVSPQAKERLDSGSEVRMKDFSEILESKVGEVIVDAPDAARMATMNEEMLATVPFNAIVTAKDYNTFFAKYPDVDAVVIMAELPQDVAEASQVNLLKKKNNKQIVCLGANVTASTKAKEWLKNKTIAAAVQRKRGFKLKDNAPTDLQKAFDEAWVLIEPDGK